MVGHPSLVYAKLVNPKLETGAGAGTTIATLFKPRHF